MGCECCAAGWIHEIQMKVGGEGLGWENLILSPHISASPDQDAVANSEKNNQHFYPTVLTMQQ